jgi:acyl carrier protein
MEGFGAGLAEMLEVDSVNETDVLKSFDAWDSLTILSIIAYVDENYKVELTAKELNSTETVGDLKALILSKKK